MRNRELSRVEQRWSRQDLFGRRRRRFPWRWILLALVLAGLVGVLTQTNLGGLRGTIESRLPAPEKTSESRADPGANPNLLPLPPLRQD
jgi:hypothetical protein